LPLGRQGERARYSCVIKINILPVPRGEAKNGEKEGHSRVKEKVFMTKEEKKKKGGLLQAIREFVYGVAAHDSARFAMKTRASMEHLFILITMGDMLGVPILPPYYSLRLLPYVVPQISTWKRRMLREKDFTDALA
jgi:hypothetical protein